jgi:hypothetical protein
MAHTPDPVAVPVRRGAGVAAAAVVSMQTLALVEPSRRGAAQDQAGSRRGGRRAAPRRLAIASSPHQTAPPRGRAREGLGGRPPRGRRRPPRARTARPGPGAASGRAEAEGERGAGRRFDSAVGPGMSAMEGARARDRAAACEEAGAGQGGPRPVQAPARLAGGAEAGEVVGAAGLGAGAGQSLAAEGLGAHHGADLVAVDVEVAGADWETTCCTRSSMREWKPKVRPMPVPFTASSTGRGRRPVGRHVEDRGRRSRG